MRNRRDGSCPVFIVSSDPCPPPPLMQRTLSGWHQTRCGFPGPGPSPHSLSLQLKRIGMDLIGPLERSARRHRFALVLVDYATRYPEAVPFTHHICKECGGCTVSNHLSSGNPERDSH